MKFNGWSIDDLINYLTEMKSAPRDRLDSDCVPKCRGELIIENGEKKDREKDLLSDNCF